MSIRDQEFTLDSVEVAVTKDGFALLSIHLSTELILDLAEWVKLRLSLRSPECEYTIENKQLDLCGIWNSILQEEIPRPVQVFLYQCLEFEESVDSHQIADSCFELANYLDLSEERSFEVSNQYRHFQLEKYGLNYYSNWFALCLNDSFVRMSQPNSDSYDRWALDYYTIYWYNLFLMNYLGYINSKLANVTGLSRKMEQTKNDFLEFLNDNQFNRISTKYLPNELYKKMNLSLGVKEEMQILETKLDRMSAYFKARREKAFNSALIAITFLSVFSVVLDVSIWFERMGADKEILWPFGSLIAGGVILLVVIIFFLLSRRK